MSIDRSPSGAIEPFYADDAVTIYHGDCREVLPSLAARIDLALTDPPFFMPAQHYSSRAEWQRSWGDTSVLAAGFASVLEAVMPLLRPTASFVTFCDAESYAVFYPELYRRFESLNALLWDKGKIGMGTPWRHSFELLIAARWKASKWTVGGGESDVLRVPVIPSARRLHPVDKPVELLAKILLPLTEPGDLLLDPYMGGGSVLEAAKKNGRRAIGIEIEERYCEVAATRCAQEVLAA